MKLRLIFSPRTWPSTIYHTVDNNRAISDLMLTLPIFKAYSIWLNLGYDLKSISSHNKCARMLPWTSLNHINLLFFGVFISPQYYSLSAVVGYHPIFRQNLAIAYATRFERIIITKNLPQFTAILFAFETKKLQQITLPE